MLSVARSGNLSPKWEFQEKELRYSLKSKEFALSFKKSSIHSCHYREI